MTATRNPVNFGSAVLKAFTYPDQFNLLSVPAKGFKELPLYQSTMESLIINETVDRLKSDLPSSPSDYPFKASLTKTQALDEPGITALTFTLSNNDEKKEEEIVLHPFSFVALLDAAAKKTTLAYYPYNYPAKLGEPLYVQVFDQPEFQFKPTQKLSLFPFSSTVVSRLQFEAVSRLNDTPFEKALLTGEEYYISRQGVTEQFVPTRLEKPLNESQQNAVDRFDSMAEGLQLIQGPAGTGKSQTITALIESAMARGEKIYVVTATNQALTVLLDRFTEAFPEKSYNYFVSASQVGKGEVSEKYQASTPEGRVKQQEKILNDAAAEWKKLDDELKEENQKLFLGFKRSALLNALKEKLDKTYSPIAFTLQSFLPQDQEITTELFNQAIEELRPIIQSRKYLHHIKDTMLKDSGVTFFTCHSSLLTLLKKGNDTATVIIDEATQATEPDLIPFLANARKVVLVGDPPQLSPFLSQEARNRNHSSLMQRLFALDYPYDFLNINYRGFKIIDFFSNGRYYGGKIEAPPVEEKTEEKEDNSVLPAVAFINVPAKTRAGNETKGVGSRGTSIANDAEVKVIQNLVNDLIHRKKIEKKDIKVISFYGEQRRKLQEALPGIKIVSVDGAQGSEAEVVILSGVRSNPNGEKGFITNPARLNVAITRAKKHFFMVGDGACLGSFVASSEDTTDDVAALVEKFVAEETYFSEEEFRARFLTKQERAPGVDDKIIEIHREVLALEKEEEKQAEEKIVPVIQELRNHPPKRLNERQEFDFLCAQLRFYEKIKSFDAAIDLIKSYPNYTENQILYRRLAMFYARKNSLASLEEAEHIVNELIENYGERSDFYQVRTDIKTKQGCFAEALVDCDTAAGLAKNPRQRFFALSHKLSVYIVMEDYARVIKDGEDLLRSSELPRELSIAISLQLIFVYYKIKNYKRAKELIASYQPQPDHHLYRRFTEFSEQIAIDCGELSVDPSISLDKKEEFDALFKKAHLLSNKENRLSSIQLLQFLLQNSTELNKARKQAVLLELIQNYFLIGNTAEIKTIFETYLPEITEKFTTEVNFDLELLYGGYLSESGQEEAAMAYFDALYDYYREHPFRCYQIARMMERLGFDYYNYIKRIADRSDAAPLFKRLYLRAQIEKGVTVEEKVEDDFSLFSLRQIEDEVSKRIIELGTRDSVGTPQLDIHKLTAEIDEKSRKGIFLKAHLLSLGGRKSIKEALRLCSMHKASYPELLVVSARISLRKKNFLEGLDILAEAIEKNIFIKNTPYHFLSILAENPNLRHIKYYPAIERILEVYPQQAELHYSAYTILLADDDYDKTKVVKAREQLKLNDDEREQFSELFSRHHKATTVSVATHRSALFQSLAVPAPRPFALIEPVDTEEKIADVSLLRIASRDLLNDIVAPMISSLNGKKLGILGGYNVDRFYGKETSNDLDIHTTLSFSEVMSLLKSFNPHPQAAHRTPMPGTRFISCYLDKKKYGISSIDITCHAEEIPAILGSHDHDALFLIPDERGNLAIPDDRKEQAERCFSVLRGETPSKRIIDKIYREDPMRILTAVFRPKKVKELERDSHRDLFDTITQFIKNKNGFELHYQNRIRTKIYRKIANKDDSEFWLNRLIEHRVIDLFWRNFSNQLNQDSDFKKFILKEIETIRLTSFSHADSYVALLFEFADHRFDENSMTLAGKVVGLRLPLFFDRDPIDVSTDVGTRYALFQQNWNQFKAEKEEQRRREDAEEKMVTAIAAPPRSQNTELKTPLTLEQRLALCHQGIRAILDESEITLTLSQEHRSQLPALFKTLREGLYTHTALFFQNFSLYFYVLRLTRENSLIKPEEDFFNTVFNAPAEDIPTIAEILIADPNFVFSDDDLSIESGFSIASSIYSHPNFLDVNSREHRAFLVLFNRLSSQLKSSCIAGLVEHYENKVAEFIQKRKEFAPFAKVIYGLFLKGKYIKREDPLETVQWNGIEYRVQKMAAKFGYCQEPVKPNQPHSAVSARGNQRRGFGRR